jgi:hypothetical protein
MSRLASSSSCCFRVNHQLFSFLPADSLPDAFQRAEGDKSKMYQSCSPKAEIKKLKERLNESTTVLFQLSTAIETAASAILRHQALLFAWMGRDWMNAAASCLNSHSAPSDSGLQSCHSC